MAQPQPSPTTTSPPIKSPETSETSGVASAGTPRTHEVFGFLRELWHHVTYERAIQFLQLLFIAGGFAIAADQASKLRESIDTSTWSALATQIMDVDKQFIENPEMVKYIYEGVPVSEDSTDYPKAYAFAVLVIDLMDSAVVMGNHIDPKIFEPDAWERYYEYQFSVSPIICEVISVEADIYGAEIVARGKKYCPASYRGPSSVPSLETRRRDLTK